VAEGPQPPDIDVRDNVPSGLKVTGEEPYHLLFVADLAGSKEANVAGPLAAGVVNVTADTFDEVMAVARPTLRFTFTDPVATGNVLTEAQLTFGSLRDLEPGAIASRLVPAKALLDLREKLAERLRGKLSADALAGHVSRAAADPAFAWLVEALKWSPAAAPADSTAVDSLLSQIDVGDEVAPAGPAPRSPIGAVVAAAAGGGRAIPAEEASAVRRSMAEADRRLAAWLTVVLHAPQVQALESAWRALAFLVSRMEFRKGLRLSVLHAREEELLARFNSLVIDPIFDSDAEAPHVVLIESQFSNTAPDLEALDEFAQHGASLPAVVLAGVSPEFFGVKHAFQMATLPPILNLFDQWQFAKWKTLRQQPYARALGVVFGRCLLRRPYARDGGDDLAFHYQEPCMTEKDLVWGSGALAAGCTIAQSVAKNGWPTAMAGYVHGRLEGFKQVQGGKKGDKTFGPADTQLVQAKIDELGVAGVNAVVAVRDHEDVLVWNGLTAARPDRAEHNALLEVSIPYQLFAGRLSALLFSLKRHLAGLAPEQVVPVVNQHIRHWVSFEGEQAEENVCVQARKAEDNPAVVELAVTVTPPPTVLPGGIPVVMGYRIG